ncbi:MAG: efflux RND transporter periplasmic adaptor subunit [Bacteroidia bacterium]
MNKLLVRIGIPVVILIVLLVVAKKVGWIGGANEIKVSIDTVGRHTITEIVSANGKVQPEKEVKISSDVSGEIVDLTVKEGQFVQKGTLLCRVNPEIYKSNLERMQANVSSARSQVDNARSSVSQAEAEYKKAEQAYNRNKQLFDQGVISQADFDNIKAAFDVSKAMLDAAKQNVSGSSFGVKGAEASLKESVENLNKTSIYAPVDGTISKLSKEKGERVVGTSMMEGTEIMRLANLNEMEVIVDVSENDIVRVHLNDTARIEIDAYSDRKFNGIVTEIANTANNSSALSTDQVTNFTVKIRILRESYNDLIPKDDPNQSPFRPGMSATVDIETKKVTNVIAIPIQAVTTRDTSVKETAKNDLKPGEGPPAKTDQTADEKSKAEKDKMKEVVFTVKDGKAQWKAVTTGIQDNNFIEITAGVTDKETVISGPYNTVSKELKNGDKVHVVDKAVLFSDKKD